MTAATVLLRAVEVVVCASAVGVLARNRAARRSPASAPRRGDDATGARQGTDVASGFTARSTPAAGQPRAGAAESTSAIVGRLLADLREALRVDEVALWRRAADRPGEWDVAIASPSSAVGAASGDLSPLLAWAAEQNVTHFDAAATVAVAPVQGGGLEVAVLTVRRAAGLEADRDLLRRWLPRCAAQVGQLSALLQTRDDFARQSAQNDALLTAARTFQQNRSVESLGSSICQTAVSITGARSAALVRWFGETETGTVQSVHPADGDLSGVVVTAGSHVAQMCANGLPQVWEDASHFDRSTPLFGLGEPVVPFGSLAIVPLKGEGGVTGAIVIAGARVGDVRIRDVRNVYLLAAMAAVSLETQWEIEEVTRRARTDQLTGLPNRRAFDEALAPALIQAERYGQPLSLILADIDHFKRVNDTLGHAAGDSVLRAVASTVQRLVRTSDLCARFGGEEIAILLPQTPQKGAEDLAERLRSAVAHRPVKVNGKDVAVTVSFGVASYRESAAAPDALFAAADRALYRAKAEGRNCVRSSPVIAD